MSNKCLRCYKEVTGFNGEMVMLKNSTWERIFGHRDGLLCISCIEVKLGRSIIVDDLMYLPNSPLYVNGKITVNVIFAKKRGLNY